MVESRKGLSKQPQAHPADEERAAREPAGPRAHGQGQGRAEDTVTLSVRTRESLRGRLRVHALQADHSVQDVVSDAIREYLDRYGQSAGNW